MHKIRYGRGNPKFNRKIQTEEKRVFKKAKVSQAFYDHLKKSGANVDYLIVDDSLTKKE